MLKNNIYIQDFKSHVLTSAYFLMQLFIFDVFNCTFIAHAVKGMEMCFSHWDVLKDPLYPQGYSYPLCQCEMSMKLLKVHRDWDSVVKVLSTSTEMDFKGREVGPEGTTNLEGEVHHCCALLNLLSDWVLHLGWSHDAVFTFPSGFLLFAFLFTQVKSTYCYEMCLFWSIQAVVLGPENDKIFSETNA